MSTNSSVDDTITPAVLSSTTGLLPTPSIGHLVTIKLTNSNYLMWKAQFVPYLRSQQLLGFVDGTNPRPAATITQATNSGARQAPNPAYHQWLLQDQLVLSALLSSLSEDILGRVWRFTTATEVWSALEGMFSSGSRARTMQIWMQLSTMKKGD